MHGRIHRDFLSCDWGTTSFRLRWLAEGEIKQEYADQAGCKAVFDSAGEDRARLFEAHLRRAIATLDPPRGKKLPLVISGMASSSIGWRELPYAQLPVQLDGTDLRVQRIEWDAP